jgi:hypothetical protein
MISNYKRERPCKNKVAHFLEKNNFKKEHSNNKRAYICNIDQRVPDFELKNRPIKIKVITKSI